MSLPVTDSALQLQLLAPLFGATNTWNAFQTFNDDLQDGSGDTFSSLFNGTAGSVAFASNAFNDQVGNNIAGTYATLDDLSAGVSNAFGYTDTEVNNLQNALTSGSVTVQNATDASNDGSGNNITSTYAPLAGATFTGFCEFQNTVNFDDRVLFFDGISLNGSANIYAVSQIDCKILILSVGHTVAGLATDIPSPGVGTMTYVTDATAPTYNGALIGGGTTVIPVFYNGTAWVSH